MEMMDSNPRFSLFREQKSRWDGHCILCWLCVGAVCSFGLDRQLKKKMASQNFQIRCLTRNNIVLRPNLVEMGVEEEQEKEFRGAGCTDHFRKARRFWSRLTPPRVEDLLKFRL
jgi:hypothetical protein